MISNSSNKIHQTWCIDIQISAVPSLRDDGCLERSRDTCAGRWRETDMTATHLACPTTSQGRAVRAVLPDRATDDSRSWADMTHLARFLVHTSRITPNSCNLQCHPWIILPENLATLKHSCFRPHSPPGLVTHKTIYLKIQLRWSPRECFFNRVCLQLNLMH